MDLEITMSKRLQQLPPYLFAELDRKKQEIKAQGKDVIDLGVGDPDLPTPDFIIDELYRAAKDPANHQYPSGAGMMIFREEIANFYKRRFDVTLDPTVEVFSLIGSKEGIAHMPLGAINPGEVVLVPDPCYPPYKSGTILAGGEMHIMPLTRENNFLPDYDAIPADILKRAKLMFINYPNNPTGACCDLDFFNKTVRFAKKHSIIVCHDASYTEMAYDGYQAPSFLQVEGARDIGVEFFSLSKQYSMTGWRIGAVVGNPKIIQLVAKVKANVDSGAFQAVQYAGIKALQQGDASVKEYCGKYKKRRDLVTTELTKLGFDVPKVKATFYLFVPVPKGYNSTDFCMKLIDEAAVIVTPGNGFGPHGEGYFRIALTLGEKRLKEAIERIKTVLNK
ncbi:LL-diaminopimelate aminotransferase [Candidatus Omnitrophota bacterium]